MKVAYIAHPISGKIEKNLKSIIKIVREINLNEPETVPFAPYWVDCHALDDDDPNERARGIKNDTALFSKGFIDELRLYGGRISFGMWEEIELAKKLEITIVPMCEATKKALEGN